MQTTIAETGTTPTDLSNAQLAVVTIARLALTTAFRIIYPLQPFLANQLEVDLVTVSALVTVQLLASLASPLGGTLADTRGERATMSAALGVFCAGTITCALAGGFGGFLAGYALVGLAMALYLPAAQSYLSRRSSYNRRGWALGIFEVSWAAAALIGVAPLMQLVQQTQQTAPVFWVLLVFGGASLALVRLALPATASAGTRGGGISWGLLRGRSIVVTLAMWGLLMLGYDLFNVALSAWLAADFAADAARLGQVFGVVGVAELVGSLSVALLVDRIGKRQAVMGALLVTAAALIALPLTSGRWELFLPLFFIFFVGVEFAIVAAIPLTSGVAPAVRGTLMALSISTNGLGRVAGSLVSEPLRSSFGIGANTTIGAILLAAAALLVHMIREAEREQSIPAEQRDIT